MLGYRHIWWLAFAVMAAPLAGLVIIALTGQLGANPIEYINRYLGDWALRALLVALAATPVKLITGWVWPVRLRRMLGLWAFAYVTLHLANYTAIDQFFDFAAIGADIVKRKFITVGMAGYAILLALAVTSPRAMVRKLGAKTWKRLHKLVYAAGVFACLHYVWMVKADLLLPAVHAGVLAVLLGVRIVHALGQGPRLRGGAKRAKPDAAAHPGSAAAR